ncbi:MAG: MFS transporter [Candidatus Cryptobacteroides sp.]
MKIKGLRWWVISMIVAITIINYLDRNTLAIMWQGIVESLGLIDAEGLTDDEFKTKSKELYAYINMFFMVAYGISQMLSGKLYDKIGTRRGFVASVLVWGVADACTSLASGVKSLCGLRACLGLGEAGPWPGATKSNAEWFPQRERAMAQGLFNAGASVGAILSPIIIALLYTICGWKLTFVIIGSLGILWIIPWLIINKKGPKEHPWITDEEKEHIISGQPECKVDNDKALSWGQILANKKSYAVILGRFFLDPIWWMFVTWLPIYLFDVYGFDVKDIGMTAWVPYVGAAIGSLAGGWFSGYLIKKGKSVNFARKCAIVLGACLTLPALIVVAFTSNAYTAVVLMAVILCGYQFSMNNIQTLCSDLYTGKSVGSLAGLGGAAATVGTIISIFLVPFLTRGSNWLPFFIMGALLVPLSLGCIFLFGGKIEQQVK